MGFDISVKEGPDEATINCRGSWMPRRRRSSRRRSRKSPRRSPSGWCCDGRPPIHGQRGPAGADLRQQKMGAGVSLYVIGSHGPVLNTLNMSGFHHSVILQDTYKPLE